jgi:hypothetical protein
MHRPDDSLGDARYVDLHEMTGIFVDILIQEWPGPLPCSRGKE